VAADQRTAAHRRGDDDLDFGAAEQVGYQKGLALLSAVGKKQNSFAHKNISL